MLSGQELLQVVKTLDEIRSYIEGGEFYNILQSIGEVEFEAAKRELNLLDQANDKRSVVWNVVGHLETAHVALEKLVASQTLKHTRGLRHGNVSHLDRWAIFWMIVGYLYLGEIAYAKQAAKYGEKNIKYGIFGDNLGHGLVQALNPTNWVEQYTLEEVPYFHADTLKEICSYVKKL